MSAENEIQKYMYRLSKIVEQLKSCGYECEGGPLKMNVAFIAFCRMAEDQEA